MINSLVVPTLILFETLAPHLHQCLEIFAIGCSECCMILPHFFAKLYGRIYNRLLLVWLEFGRASRRVELDPSGFKLS